jgi:hypothetical protein
MTCTKCNQPIALERLEAVPDATMCVVCLKLTGDVQTRRGYARYDHKTAGELEVVSQEQFQRIRELPGAIQDRVSRL